jgi:thioredoxin reductase
MPEETVEKKGTPEEATKEIKIDGFFLAIGHTPNTEVFKKYIEVDAPLPEYFNKLLKQLEER